MRTALEQAPSRRPARLGPQHAHEPETAHLQTRAGAGLRVPGVHISSNHFVRLSPFMMLPLHLRLTVPAANVAPRGLVAS